MKNCRTPSEPRDRVRLLAEVEHARLTQQRTIVDGRERTSKRGSPPRRHLAVRLDTIVPENGTSDASARIWADVLGQTRVQAQAPARYVVAMAISPDLLPVTAACTGLVLRRPRLVERGLGALHEFSAAQTHVNTTTILVAFAAGVAGMLAVETRASSAVGVAISVTTIPATAYLGVELGIGAFRTSLSALAVLAANIAMRVAGGLLALAVQRTLASSTRTSPS